MVIVSIGSIKLLADRSRTGVSDDQKVMIKDGRE